MSKKKSRVTRFTEAQAKIENAGMDFVDLRDELESWLDNMPENLQESPKAEQLQEAIDELGGVIDSVEEIVYTGIEFPGAFG